MEISKKGKSFWLVQTLKAYCIKGPDARMCRNLPWEKNVTLHTWHHDPLLLLPSCQAICQPCCQPTCCETTYCESTCCPPTCLHLLQHTLLPALSLWSAPPPKKHLQVHDLGTVVVPWLYRVTPYHLLTILMILPGNLRNVNSYLSVWNAWRKDGVPPPYSQLQWLWILCHLCGWPMWRSGISLKFSGKIFTSTTR